MKSTMGKRGLVYLITVVMVLSMLMTVPQLSVTSEAASKKYVKSLSVKKKVTVEKGKKVTVNPTVKVVKKASKQVTVKSKNKKIAKVSYSKKKNTITITGVKVGKTTITVTTKAKNKKGKKISKKISVTVKKQSKQESTTAKPTTEKPTTEKPTTEKPTTEKPTTEKPTTEEPTKPEQPTLEPDTGKVLNIYSVNEEFLYCIKDHYPDYEEIDATTGKIGDVEVRWNITPATNNGYQNGLDGDLLNQSDAAADEKIDLFLVEPDYALKYVDSDYTMAVSDLGITNTDLAQQYQYTKDIVTDSNGVLKALTWQASPSVMFYNRDVALEVLGTEDPAEVQQYVKNWDTFMETAETMKENGYSMVSSVYDTYRTYSNNATSKWVDENGEVNIDDNLMAWADDSKALVDAGSAGTHGLWAAEWNAGFYPEGKVFAYFGPAWLMNFCMAADQEGSVGNLGRWGATEGPQSAYWGGTWICAATGTDNKNLIKDILLKLTCDEDVMKGIVEQDDDFVNNKAVMDELAKSDYSSQILGGQNPLGVYSNNAAALDMSNVTINDPKYNSAFQNAMKGYIDGTITKEEALAMFEELLTEEEGDEPSGGEEEGDEPSGGEDVEWTDGIEDRLDICPVGLVGQTGYALCRTTETSASSYVPGLTWSSSDESVLTIHENYGYIEYIGVGEATIFATYKGETWEALVVVGSADAGEYPVSISCNMDSVTLDLDGEYSWENPLEIEYTLTGTYPSTVECWVYANPGNTVVRRNWPELETGKYTIEVYPYAEYGASTGNMTTIVWDPETRIIYGVHVISTTVY